MAWSVRSRPSASSTTSVIPETSNGGSSIVTRPSGFSGASRRGLVRMLKPQDAGPRSEDIPSGGDLGMLDRVGDQVAVERELPAPVAPPRGIAGGLEHLLCAIEQHLGRLLERRAAQRPPLARR